MVTLSQNRIGFNTSGNLHEWVRKIVHELDGRCYGGGHSRGTCLCPAHDDSRPSLSVSAGDGKLLVKCQAGCSQEAVIAALKQRGLWPVHAKQIQPVSKADQWRREREQKFDDYQRKCWAWEILYAANQNHTKSDHDMLRRYLKGRGIDSVPVNAMLIRRSQCKDLNIHPRSPAMVLPVIRGRKLIAAHVTFLNRDGSDKLDTDTPRKMFGPVGGGFIQFGDIWSAQELVTGEGIESVLSAAQLIGWPAITSMSATNLPNITQYAPKAKEIVIAADNDDAGRKAAEEAARRFNMSGCRVRIAWPPDDYNDWNEALCAADPDVAELRRAILDAPIFDERVEAQALSMTEVMRMEIPPREYLLKPWLETSSLNMIHGQRGEGKTFLMTAIAYAIATGTDFLGWMPQRKARVLYVDGELPGSLLQKRLQYLGPPTDNLHILSRDILLRDRNIVLPDLATPEGRAFLDKAIEQDRSEVIMLDSLSTLFRSGVENDAEPWQEPQDWMMGHRFQDRVIIYAHHEGRSGKPRGTSKREDPLDAMVRIRKRDDLKESDTESAFEISYTKERSFTDTGRPLIAHMSVSTESGTTKWRHEFANNVKEKVNELLDEGWSQKDIAKELGLSKSRISQIASESRSHEEV